MARRMICGTGKDINVTYAKRHTAGTSDLGLGTRQPCSTWSQVPGARCLFSSAFTLIELLVVISIIGLLMMIGVPSVYKAQTNFKRTQSKATINILNGACLQYKEDGNQELVGGVYKDRYPPGGAASLVTRVANKNYDATYKKYRGPYNGAENVNVVGGVFVDSFSNPIYYYRAELDTNDKFTSWSGAPAVDSYITVSNSSPGVFFRGDFALMSAGPDGLLTAYKDDPTTDDCTNFLPE